MITFRMENKLLDRMNEVATVSGLKAGIVLKKAAIDTLASILKPPPYGTHPVDTGRARAGWYASARGLGATSKVGSFTSRLKSPSQVDIGKKEGSYEESLTGYDKGIVMTNSVPYILYLEYGHSRLQAPYGMVRVSLRKLYYKLARDIATGMFSPSGYRSWGTRMR